MSDWFHYDLYVLAPSSEEVKTIAVRLNQPWPELVAHLAQRLNLSKVEGLGEIFDFRIVQNLADIEAFVRRFRLTIQDRFRGAVAMQLFEMSGTFPDSIFLLKTEGTSFSRKEIVRGGKLVRQIQSGDRRTQLFDWGVLDIFAPFWAEYGAKLAFGSLWGPCSPISLIS